MKIAIVNDVHVGQSLIHGNKVRASSGSISEMFESYLNNIARQHKPDLFINLGDLIRSESKEIDHIRYLNMIKHYGTLNFPVIHLIGNHEIKHLKQADIDSIWNLCGFKQNTYGYRPCGEYNILWLGIDNDHENKHSLFVPQEQLKWLKQTLKQSKQPFFIFIHTPIDDHDVNGNFFYEALDARKKDALFLKNQEEVRQIISSENNVAAVFQAHLHYFHTRLLDGIPYITCPAMNDNICGPEIVGNIPEIYTVVDIDEQKISVKAYSREYCFSGYEQQLSL